MYQKVAAQKKSKRGRGKKGKKSKLASSSRRKFSRKFRKSLRRSSRKSMFLRRRNKNKMFSRGGAGAATMTIPSFSQNTPNGTSIINQLASNHAQTLAYSSFDGDVKMPATTTGSAPSASI